MGSRISLRGNLERKSCIGRCSNSVKEKKQSLPAVSTDFPDDLLPFVASVEQNPLKGRTGFRVGDLYQEPFVREISLDRFDRQGLHKKPALTSCKLHPRKVVVKRFTIVRIYSVGRGAYLSAGKRFVGRM